MWLEIYKYPRYLPTYTKVRKVQRRKVRRELPLFPGYVFARLNADPEVDGILVQLPLPKGLDEQAVIRAIAPEKDVDGFHPVSLGRLLVGLDTFVPCTPAGIVELLLRSGVDPAGKHAVVVGRSNIVGKPLAALLSRKGRGGNATVTLCHTATPDLGAFTRAADILVVAAGRPGTSA